MLGRMALAVCLLFDARGERLMRELWARLEEQGIPTLQTHTHGLHHPHLSYAVLLDWDLDDVMRTLTDLPDGGAFSLAFHGTVAFPRGRAAIVPSVSADVMRWAGPARRSTTTTNPAAGSRTARSPREPRDQRC